jgi:hypothetical protein
LLHVSDLHVGDLDPNDDAKLDPQPPPWWPTVRWFDGYLGHSGLALRQLTTFFLRLRRRGDVRLLVTGDITAVGSPSEFALARGYLEGRVQLRSGAYLGLDDAGALAHRSIPGNHDHWRGVHATGLGPLVMFGAPTSSLRGTFPPPLRTWRVPLPNSVNVAFARIDTDDEVGPRGPNRFFARGKFSGPLGALEREWSPVDPNEVRVLLLHHSPQHSGYVLGIDRQTRALLQQVIERCQISVILTGHMHVPRGRVVTATDGRATWDVLEARCGTTTQRDTLPTGWVSGGPPLPPNSLLVHTVDRLSDGRLEWNSKLYERSARRFRARRSFPVQGRFPGQGTIVWPR